MSCCQLVTGLTSGVTQAAGSRAGDALSLVPSPCHASDPALGLSQTGGDGWCRGQVSTAVQMETGLSQG